MVFGIIEDTNKYKYWQSNCNGSYNDNSESRNVMASKRNLKMNPYMLLNQQVHAILTVHVLSIVLECL